MGKFEYLLTYPHNVRGWSWLFSQGMNQEVLHFRGGGVGHHCECLHRCRNCDGCCRCCINPCCIYVRVWCLVVFNRPQFHFASSDSKQALSGCIPPQLSSCHIFSGDFTPTMCHHIFDLISNRFSFNLFFFLYFFFWLSMDVSVSKTTWYIFICWMTGGQRGAHLKFKTQSVAVNGVCFTFWHYVESYIAKSAYLSSLPMVCQDLKLSIFTKDTFLSILFINLSKYVLVSTSPLPR